MPHLDQMGQQNHLEEHYIFFFSTGNFLTLQSISHQVRHTNRGGLVELNSAMTVSPATVF